MSFFIASAIVGGSVLVGAGVSYYQGEKALEQQERAQKAADAAAKKAEKQADEAFNAANQKAPDILALMKANSLKAGGGISGTMLTGTAGNDPSKSLLGKVTPLGR